MSSPLLLSLHRVGHHPTLRNRLDAKPTCRINIESGIGWNPYALPVDGISILPISVAMRTTFRPRIRRSQGAPMLRRSRLFPEKTAGFGGCQFRQGGWRLALGSPWQSREYQGGAVHDGTCPTFGPVACRTGPTRSSEAACPFLCPNDIVMGERVAKGASVRPSIVASGAD